MDEGKFAELIKLRGHHVSFFLEYLLWNYAPPAWNIFAHLIPKYGELYVKNIKKLFEYLNARPEKNILIVENIPDNLCDSGCVQRSENCFRQTNHDRVAAECYELKIGYSYSVSYFINEIRSKQQIGKYSSLNMPMFNKKDDVD